MVRDAAFLARKEVFEGGRRKALAFGCLLVAFIVAGLLLSPKPAHAATFEVDSTADTDTSACTTAAASDCTLRGAINAANAAAGADTIGFNIPDDPNVAGNEVRTIKPTSELPAITEAVTVDGYSQPGSKANTLAVGNDAVLKIELDGSEAGERANGLWIWAADSTVRGLAINRFGSPQGSGIRAGIVLFGDAASTNKVEGNFIGTDATGTLDRGNAGPGVSIRLAPSNVVGGVKPASRNVISGNDSDAGVEILFDGATGNKVQGNYLGTDKTGTQDLGNSENGVEINAASSATASGDNVVGGTETGARNVISGNNNVGVQIGGGPTGNRVEGNFIGTDATGTTDLGNRFGGVKLIFSGTSNHVVGGVQPAARNVISGNDGDGVYIWSDSGGNRVQGNFIGTDKNGTLDVGNTGNGVEIFNSPGNKVGGTEAGAGNKIAFNRRDQFGDGGSGVRVSGGSNSTGNTILRNSIFSNADLGIDLQPDGANPGVTPNDPDDADTGPNNLQNYPVLTSAKSSRKGTRVAGTLNSTPDTAFTVQFFANPSGTDEGKTFLGEKTSVTTDANGDAAIFFSTRKRSSGAITATATDPEGNTSEFSAAKKVVRKR